MAGTNKALGENGYSFALSVVGRESWGDLRIEFKFELPWTSGSIEFLSSEGSD